MPGSAAAAMAMKRKRNAEKNKDKDAGPRAAPVLEEGMPLHATTHPARTRVASARVSPLPVVAAASAIDRAQALTPAASAGKSEEQVERKRMKLLAAKA